MTSKNLSNNNFTPLNEMPPLSTHKESKNSQRNESNLSSQDQKTLNYELSPVEIRIMEFLDEEGIQTKHPTSKMYDYFDKIREMKKQNGCPLEVAEKNDQLNADKPKQIPSFKSLKSNKNFSFSLQNIVEKRKSNFF